MILKAVQTESRTIPSSEVPPKKTRDSTHYAFQKRGGSLSGLLCFSPRRRLGMQLSVWPGLQIALKEVQTKPITGSPRLWVCGHGQERWRESGGERSEGWLFVVFWAPEWVQMWNYRDKQDGATQKTYLTKYKQHNTEESLVLTADRENTSWIKVQQSTQAVYPLVVRNKMLCLFLWVNKSPWTLHWSASCVRRAEDTREHRVLVLASSSELHSKYNKII